MCPFGSFVLRRQVRLLDFEREERKYFGPSFCGLVGCLHCILAAYLAQSPSVGCNFRESIYWFNFTLHSNLEKVYFMFLLLPSVQSLQTKKVVFVQFSGIRSLLQFLAIALNKHRIRRRIQWHGKSKRYGGCEYQKRVNQRGRVCGADCGHWALRVLPHKEEVSPSLFLF